MTGLLRAWGAGDARASDSLVRLVYAELRRQARIALRREGEGHTLQPTALVHEAWLRLGDQHDARWESRTQFFAIAAQTMRRVLLDHARTRHALKRGGGAVQVTLGGADRVDAKAGARAAESTPLDAVDVIALDDALDAARRSWIRRRPASWTCATSPGSASPKRRRSLGVSTATVGREWAIARMWLRRELEP